MVCISNVFISVGTIASPRRKWQQYAKFCRTKSIMVLSKVTYCGSYRTKETCPIGQSNLEIHWLVHWNLVNSFESREDDCQLCDTSPSGTQWINQWNSRLDRPIRQKCPLLSYNGPSKKLQLHKNVKWDMPQVLSLVLTERHSIWEPD